MRTLIFALLLSALSAHATETEMVEVPAEDVAVTRTGRFSAGAGFEGRAREEVNPDSTDGHLLPHFFAQYRYNSMGVSLEGGYESRETKSGALSIESRSYQLGAWGRYEFREPLHWSPFAGMGAGYYFDQVTSRYFNESDERSGRRGFWGLGGGISHAAMEHLLLEAELRAALIQDRKDVSYSALFRIGYVL